MEQSNKLNQVNDNESKPRLLLTALNDIVHIRTNQLDELYNFENNDGKIQLNLTPDNTTQEPVVSNKDSKDLNPAENELSNADKHPILTNMLINTANVALHSNPYRLDKEYFKHDMPWLNCSPSPLVDNLKSNVDNTTPSFSELISSGETDHINKTLYLMEKVLNEHNKTSKENSRVTSSLINILSIILPKLKNKIQESNVTLIKPYNIKNQFQMDRELNTIINYLFFSKTNTILKAEGELYDNQINIVGLNLLPFNSADVGYQLKIEFNNVRYIIDNLDNIFKICLDSEYHKSTDKKDLFKEFNFEEDNELIQKNEYIKNCVNHVKSLIDKVVGELRENHAQEFQNIAKITYSLDDINGDDIFSDFNVKYFIDLNDDKQKVNVKKNNILNKAMLDVLESSNIMIPDNKLDEYKKKVYNLFVLANDINDENIAKWKIDNSINQVDLSLDMFVSIAALMLNCPDLTIEKLEEILSQSSDSDDMIEKIQEEALYILNHIVITDYSTESLKENIVKLFNQMLMQSESFNMSSLFNSRMLDFQYDKFNYTINFKNVPSDINFKPQIKNETVMKQVMDSLIIKYNSNDNKSLEKDDSDMELGIRGELEDKMLNIDNYYHSYFNYNLNKSNDTIIDPNLENYKNMSFDNVLKPVDILFDDKPINESLESIFKSLNINNQSEINDAVKSLSNIKNNTKYPFKSLKNSKDSKDILTNDLLELDLKKIESNNLSLTNRLSDIHDKFLRKFDKYVSTITDIDTEKLNILREMFDSFMKMIINNELSDKEFFSWEKAFGNKFKSLYDDKNIDNKDIRTVSDAADTEEKEGLAVLEFISSFLAKNMDVFEEFLDVFIKKQKIEQLKNILQYKHINYDTKSISFGADRKISNLRYEVKSINSVKPVEESKPIDISSMLPTKLMMNIFTQGQKVYGDYKSGKITSVDGCITEIVNHLDFDDPEFESAMTKTTSLLKDLLSDNDTLITQSNINSASGININLNKNSKNKYNVIAEDYNFTNQFDDCNEALNNINHGIIDDLFDNQELDNFVNGIETVINKITKNVTRIVLKSNNKNSDDRLPNLNFKISRVNFNDNGDVALCNFTNEDNTLVLRCHFNIESDKSNIIKFTDLRSTNDKILTLSKPHGILENLTNFDSLASLGNVTSLMNVFTSGLATSGLSGMFQGMFDGKDSSMVEQSAVPNMGMNFFNDLFSGNAAPADQNGTTDTIEKAKSIGQNLLGSIFSQLG